MFYPPKGLCKADTEGGPIVFTYVLFWVRKRILDFQFTGGFWHFLNLQNVLFDGVGWGGTEYQKCPLKIFILCRYIDKVYTYLYTKLKLSPTLLWVSKFDVKLGVWVKIFKFTAGR